MEVFVGFLGVKLMLLSVALSTGCDPWFLDSDGDCNMNVGSLVLTGSVVGALVLGIRAFFNSRNQGK